MGLNYLRLIVEWNLNAQSICIQMIIVPILKQHLTVAMKPICQLGE